MVVAGEFEALVDPGGDDERRALLSDWRRQLADLRLAASTVNLALAGTTSLLDSRALQSRKVQRVEVDPKEARALSREQPRETDRLASSRDRAIISLVRTTGVRIGNSRCPRSTTCGSRNALARLHSVDDAELAPPAS